MRVRLVPVGEIFRRMPFVVRDLARDSGKRVHLELTGQATEIDKFLVERMMDPVLHLVRNAISHGIETPEQRIAAGKPPDAHDPSRRLDRRRNRRSRDRRRRPRHRRRVGGAARARSLGLVVPDGVLDSRALLDIICASGFSTRDEADRGSGRGVGMAVVRDTVQGLGGTLAVETRPGRGTTFRMTLPLTLAITDAIIAHVGDQIFAVPQTAVREVIEVDAGAAARLRAQRADAVSRRDAADRPAVDMFSLPSDAAAALSRHRGRHRAWRPSACSSIASPASVKSSSRRSPIR